jgi:hypothetical protein
MHHGPCGCGQATLAGYGGGRIGGRKLSASIAAGPLPNRESDMSTRSTSRSIVFRRPFILGGFEAVQAAGTYVIDVEEEAIEDLSFPAFRRLSTQMRIPTLGGFEHRFINPVELDEALLRDAAQDEPQSGPASPVAQSMKREKAQRAKARLVKRY